MTRRATVLLVDDDHGALARTSTQILRYAALRCTVHSAMSHRIAVESAALFRPSCIILDVDSKAIDCKALLAEIGQRDGGTPTVIGVVNRREDHDILELMRLGVRELLTHNEMHTDRLGSVIGALITDADLQRRLTQAEIRQSETAKRLEDAYRYAQFLTATSQRFAETLNFDEALDLIGAIACPFLGDVCIVDLYDANVLYRKAIIIDEPVYAALDTELSKLAPTIDAQLGVPLALRSRVSGYYEADALMRVGRDDAAVADLRRAGLRRLTVVPLSTGGKILGTICFGSASNHDDYELLRVSTHEQFTRIAAVSLENCRVLERARLAQTQAETAQRRLSFQSRVSALLSRSLRWKTTLERLVKLFTLSVCDTAEIFLFDDDRQLQHVALAASALGVAEIVGTLRRRFPVQLEDEAGPGFVARTGRSKMYVDDTIAQIRRVVNEVEQSALYDQWAPVSSVVVPFFIEGRVAGVIAAIRDRSGALMNFDDLSLIEDVGRRLASYLANARLFEREHTIASELQRSLLPKLLPEIAHLRIASRYLAGAAGVDVGGDWYDVLEVSPERIAITIGDVVGRGVVSAATMGQLRSLLRAYAFEEIGPARTLERVNELLLRTGDERYATAVVMMYDTLAQTITFANAGHPPPIVIDPAGSATLLGGTTGLPIGAWPGATYIEQTAAFPPGSTLVLYTDGLVETRERDMHSGTMQLAARLHNAETEPETLADDLLSEFAPDLSDDTALLVIRALSGNERFRRRWSMSRIDALSAMSMRRECLKFLQQFTEDEEGMFGASLVLGELLGNIARHASGEAYVLIDWREELAQITIGDRGPGIDALTSRELEGDLFRESGRGLAIIRHHVARMAFSPRKGGGTIVEVTLHLDKSPQVAAC